MKQDDQHWGDIADWGSAVVVALVLSIATLLGAIGRPPGSKNFFSCDIKEAIIAAVNEFGLDSKGLDGLKGFVRRMCFKHPDKVYTSLQAIMGTQVTMERQEKPKEYRTIEDVRAELEQYGIKIKEPFQLEFYKGPIVELDGTSTDTDADELAL